MGKAKSNGIDRETISGIFRHFGALPDKKTVSAWKKAADIISLDMKTAAASYCLPNKSRWKKIQSAAEKHGWKPAEANAS